MNQNYFILLCEDLLSLILPKLVINNSQTYGLDSTTNIIRIILSSVCKDWNTFLSKYIKIDQSFSGKKLYNNIFKINPERQLYWCHNISSDYLGFSKLNVTWVRVYKTNLINRILCKKIRRHIRSESTERLSIVKKILGDTLPILYRKDVEGDLMTINNFSFNESKQMHSNLNTELIRWFGCVQRLNHINISKILSFSIEQESLKVLFEDTDFSLNYLIHGSYNSSSYVSTPLNCNLIKSIMYQLLSSLEYCHSLNICHGNISPFRILFKIVPEGFLLKLVDFMHSPSFVNRKDIKNQYIKPSYKSPELYVNNIYTTKNDIWASGMMMFMMSSGYYFNWEDEGTGLLLERIDTLSINQEMKKLLTGLLRPKYQLRFSAQGALRQICFNKIFSECSVVLTYLKIDKNENNNEREYGQNNGWFLKRRDFIIMSNSIYRNNYLLNTNSKMWTILIIWLIEICYDHKFSPSTLIIATKYLNSYLSYVDISRHKFQILGCSALYLASLWNESLLLDMKDYVYLTDNCFKEKDLAICVKDLFIKLNGKMYIYTINDIIENNSNIIYSKNLMNWFNILCFITQLEHNLVLLDTELLGYNLLLIIDMINEIITGISNISLRTKIYSTRDFKKSQFEFISIFHKVFSNNKFIQEKYFETYIEEVPINSLLKNLSNKDRKVKNKNGISVCLDLLIKESNLNDKTKLNLSKLNTIKQDKDINDFNLRVSIYSFTKCIITRRLKNIGTFPFWGIS